MEGSLDFAVNSGPMGTQPRTFVFMENEEFVRLSKEERAEYIKIATAALKSGAPIDTPNKPDPNLQRLRFTKDQ